MRTGITHLPLHSGRAPAWLFGRMKLLAREIVLVILRDFGPGELLRRLSDPFWFQALGCTLGFDWHSSGLTTTTCGALKEGIRGMEHEIGFFVCGGKGRVSRATPREIEGHGKHLRADPGALVYASRMAAKVDSAAVQDGYALYHHVFLFDRDGRWAVVQQGMNDETKFARRYHWLGGGDLDFVCEPHRAVCCDRRGAALNLVAREGEAVRAHSASLARESPERILGEWRRVERLDMPAHHPVTRGQIGAAHLHRVLLRTYEQRPADFEALLGTAGVGAKTLRALALLSELLYGAKPSFRDPARFSFAHGGKDGTPFPVDRPSYDRTVAVMESAIRRAKTGNRERLDAIRRLARFYEI